MEQEDVWFYTHRVCVTTYGSGSSVSFFFLSNWSLEIILHAERKYRNERQWQRTERKNETAHVRKRVGRDRQWGKGKKDTKWGVRVKREKESERRRFEERRKKETRIMTPRRKRGRKSWALNWKCSAKKRFFFVTKRYLFWSFTY